MNEGIHMAFGETLARINGDRTQPSFTGITGRKADYDDSSPADEREQSSQSE
jgi:hypothetical protein